MCASSTLNLILRFPRVATRILQALLVVLVCTGCALFSVGVESLKNAGITESDRQELLQKQAKEFHNIMTFGRLDAAAPFIEEELKATLLPKLARLLKTDKFIEHTVDDVRYADDSRTASMSLTVKVFRNTDFLVRERILTEHWKFHTDGSWGLVSYEFSDLAP